MNNFDKKKSTVIISNKVPIFLIKRSFFLCYVFNMNHSSSNNEDLREEFKNLIIKIEPYYVSLKSDLGIYEV